MNIATVDATFAVMELMPPYERSSPAAHAAAAAAGRAARGKQPPSSAAAVTSDRYSSLDSNDTFLSCNTHPFPSQGSLAGLEELAAKGSMAANGSMPAVNITGINTVIVNPFEPPSKKQQLRQQQQQQQDSAGSESPHRRGARLSARSRSTDAAECGREQGRRRTEWDEMRQDQC